VKLKHQLLACAAFASFSVSPPSLAASYNFNVEYQGNGSAALLAGDNPIGTTLLPGDSFIWNILAEGTGFWHVSGNVSLFPFMSFAVSQYGDETGERIGDFTLSLRNNGGEVFTLTQTGASQRFIHIGTNLVSLTAGLDFDEMQLNYSLISSDLNGGPDAGSTPYGDLMGFAGSPEFSSDGYGTIFYLRSAPIPEPETYAMLLCGLGLLGFAARRRKLKEASVA